MSYPPRIELPGRAYHVNAKAVADGRLFGDDEDCDTFLMLLRRELGRSAWRCVFYALMGTHYHVLIRIERETLSNGFQHLQAAYARCFNKRYGRRGALGNDGSTTC